MKTLLFDVPEEELEEFKMYMHNVKATHAAVASARDYAEREMWKNSLVTANLDHNEELGRIFHEFADMEQIEGRPVLGTYIDTITRKLVVKVEDEEDKINTVQNV